MLNCPFSTEILSLFFYIPNSEPRISIAFFSNRKYFIPNCIVKFFCVNYQRFVYLSLSGIK